MMALSDKQYEELDAKYAAEREPFDTRVKHYPLLEKVIDGEVTFENSALELSGKFMRTLEMVRTLGKMPVPGSFPDSGMRAENYMKELMSFVRMVEDLGTTTIPVAEDAFNDYLAGRKKIRDTDWPGTNEVFDMLWAASKMLDRDVRKLYAPALFRENPRLFREVYADMSLEERAYTEARLYRMLSAGIFSGKAGIDELALKQSLNEPELRRQFDKYIDNVIAYATGGKVKDPATMRDHGPDESFMRSIEERLEPPITQQLRDQFRSLLARDAIRHETEGKTYDYTSNEPIRRAIEQKIEDIPALRDKR